MICNLSIATEVLGLQEISLTSKKDQSRFSKVRHRDQVQIYFSSYLQIPQSSPIKEKLMMLWFPETP